MPLTKNLDGVQYYALYSPRQDRYVRIAPGKPMLIKRLKVAQRQLEILKELQPRWDLVIHSFTLSQNPDPVPLQDDPR
jgi:hypothetical protein